MEWSHDASVRLENIKKVYFIGIGGIGMSALARYFMGRGVAVFGYDRTETTLTQALAAEGMVVHYTDDVAFVQPDADLVIYTPAVPQHHTELNWYRAQNIPVLKRSEVLGIISRGMKCIGVAGTHGKTTTSALVTHVLRTGGIDCTAFLGGISVSAGSNFVVGASEWVVVEADEYDRSFLRLSPDMAIINSMDPDHLDIYGDEAQFKQGFIDFTKKIKPNGRVFLKNDLILRGEDVSVTWQSFGSTGGDFRAENVRVEDGFFVFDLASPIENIEAIKTALPGLHNVENATAAVAVAQVLGVSAEAIKTALASFKGIKRRFEFVVRQDQKVFIDDYAHHPTELNAAITAAKTLYPGRHITGIFQPHLFTRTRDFQEGFAAALSQLDRVILMDIYPARELPIEGVTSEIIFDKITIDDKVLVTKASLLPTLTTQNIDVLLTLGAGDIDTFVAPIQQWLEGSEPI